MPQDFHTNLPVSTLLPRIVLSFAPSDPSCGSGAQGDVLTISSLGAYPLSAMTGITVQDSSVVEDIQATDGDWLADQARALLEDMPVHAFKVGALCSIDNLGVVAEILSDYPEVPVVFSPAFSFGHTDATSDEEMREAMIELLLPLTTVLIAGTAQILRFASSDDDENEDEEPSAAACARGIIDVGSSFVLATGTHEQAPQIVNTLFGDTGVIRADAWDRLPGSFHGAGSTLSAALATQLALGLDVPEAVGQAQRYVWEALAHGWRLGMGRTIPNRFFAGLRS